MRIDVIYSKLTLQMDNAFFSSRCHSFRFSLAINICGWIFSIKVRNLWNSVVKTNEFHKISNVSFYRVMTDTLSKSTLTENPFFERSFRRAKP